MEANQIELRTLLVSISTVVSIELATTLLISQGPHNPLLILGAARLLEIVLIILIVSIWGKGFPAIGLVRSEMVPGLKKGLLWSAGFGVVTFLASVGLLAAGINPLTLIRTNLPTNPREITIFFVIGGMVGPIAEEVFFRGVLYGFLRRWGVAVALVLSTLIFVLSHAIVHGVPITQAVGGILFALAYEVEGCLIVPITIHCLGNLAIFTLSLIL